MDNKQQDRFGFAFVVAVAVLHAVFIIACIAEIANRMQW